MKFQYMMLGENVSSLERKRESHGFGAQYLPDFRFPGKKLVLGIDPGSTGVGMSIGLAESPTVLGISQIQRSDKLLEKTPEVFTKHFTSFIEEFIRTNNVEAIQIEDQYLNPKYKHAYRVLTTFTDSIKGVAQQTNTRIFNVAPQAWKGVFLERYPLRKTLSMNQSNKEHIMTWAREICPALYSFNGKDAFDSFGILYYYYKTNFRSGGNHVIEVRTDMPKDYRSQITLIFGKLDRNKSPEKIITIAEGFRKTSKVERNVQMFKPTEYLSLEDNIRSLITNNNDIYVAFCTPYNNMMAELFKNRDKIGYVDLDTPMYVLGFRTKGK